MIYVQAYVFAILAIVGGCLQAVVPEQDKCIRLRWSAAAFGLAAIAIAILAAVPLNRTPF